MQGRLKEIVIANNDASKSRISVKVIDSQLFAHPSPEHLPTHQQTASAEFSFVRKVIPLIPPELPGAQDVIRQLCNSFDHNMIAYLTQFERIPSK